MSLAFLFQTITTIIFFLSLFLSLLSFNPLTSNGKLDDLIKKFRFTNILESDGYSGGVTTSGSGYDGIYAPISSPGTGYGRYNPQRNGQQVNGSHLIVGNLKSNNNNNNSSKNNGNLFSHIRNKQVNNNQRVNSRDEDESFEPHTQRYATEWD